MTSTPGRLLSLLSLLQARRDWPGRLLAERLQVSARTVRRDVDRLRELGYPVQAAMGPDGGYRLQPGAELPPLLFDDEQAIALTVALQLAATSGAAIADGAARALATVGQVLPSRLRHRVDAVHVTTLDPADAGLRPLVDPAVLVSLTAALRAREVLRFDYDPPLATSTGEGAALLPVRRVEPHHLLTRAGRWYLLAFDLDRGDWRTFRADRIHPRTPTGPRFTPRPVPGGDAGAFVSARFKGSTGPDRWPCRGTVVLGVPAEQIAPYLPDDASVEALDDHRCRLTTGAWSWTGLAATIGRLDADITAADPPRLREAFTTLAHRYTTAGAG